MSDLYFYYYPQKYICTKSSYYNAMLRLMDYITTSAAKHSVIYILNSEKQSYKIYDSECICIFTCDVKSPDLLLDAIIKLLPKKIILLNSLDKGLDRTLLLLFNCIGDV